MNVEGRRGRKRREGRGKGGVRFCGRGIIRQ